VKASMLKRAAVGRRTPGAPMKIAQRIQKTTRPRLRRAGAAGCIGCVVSDIGMAHVEVALLPRIRAHTGEGRARVVYKIAPERSPLLGMGT
jgi:hypothetical protein